MQFVLLPGAGGMAWYWHRVAPLLESAGHEAIAVELPGDDESKGLNDYADIAVRAIAARSDVVLVAQSLGGFTALLVCERASVRSLVFVNAMIPIPNEKVGEWWGHTGAAEAREATARAGGYSPDFDVPTYFLHDVPEAVLRDGPARQRQQAETIFAERCRFRGWPAIPTHVIAGSDDRFFPLEFQKRVARERLNVEPLVIAGGHLIALSNPEQLAASLLRCAQETNA